MSSSQLFYESVKGSHEFKINGYTYSKGTGVAKSSNSGRFTVGDYDWFISFFAGGCDHGSEEYISVFIELASPGEVSASVEFKLLDQRREVQIGLVQLIQTNAYEVHKCPCQTFEPDRKVDTVIKKLASHSCSLDFPKLGNILLIFVEMENQSVYERPEFETSNYLKDDRLSIHGTVSIVQTRFEEDKRYVIHVPPSNMIQNVKGLLESEVGSDVTFHIGSEEFRAHKSILAARSPVFKAMFFGLVGNPDMKTVVIEEFDPFAFKAMLLFLYSDELPEAHELSDLDSVCTSTTLMQHMLAAADRFDLARLKLMCEAKLYEDIAANTVADTLSLAERYQCQELKTACLNFAAKPKNLGEVMKSDGYSNVEKWCPSLLTDLLKKCMRL
ncbi:BTB/POZ and MATH domain-containing protein 3-like [Papaver somniferum]|uniref:BTB/POZ and MATH domain-containing protein 3-like n=1 Tax=Papaver somniferum TaxID=3469 RepID=UPI000E70048C|nr:BTB/POZ and MATH domain-containing protein 3-like [Papaver somniferum]